MSWNRYVDLSGRLRHTPLAGLTDDELAAGLVVCDAALVEVMKDPPHEARERVIGALATQLNEEFKRRRT